MMHSILFTLVILALAALSTAFPTGSGTCFSNQTIIEGVPGQPMGTLKDLGYSFAITMKNDNYIPGGPPVKFCVHGKDAFKGLLVYGLDVKKNRVGSWNIPSGAPFKILNLNCTGDPMGTLTHSDPSLKGPNVCVEWVPPKTDVGQINFVGTVVQGKVAGFQIIKFPTIFTVKDSKFTPSTIWPASSTTCNVGMNTMTYETTTYETNTYKTNTYKTNTYESTAYEETPTQAADGGFIPPTFNAANGLTYSGYILLLQIIFISSLTFYYH